MPPTPLILSPALPSELLAYIIQHETYPTTLLICFSSAEFLSSLIVDMQNPQAHTDIPDDLSLPAATTLLAAPLYQVAVARHIRLVFIPTVSHLRAYLSVFSPKESKVPPPPTSTLARGNRRKQPLLMVYGFLGLHRDTSEWSAQGISATAAALVDAASNCGFRAVMVDAPRLAMQEDAQEGEENGASDGEGVSVANGEGETMLAEELPVLSASVVRAGGDLDDAAWTGRKVSLGRVLGRWFQYRQGNWAQRRRMTRENSHQDAGDTKITPSSP